MELVTPPLLSRPVTVLQPDTFIPHSLAGVELSAHRESHIFFF
jgi:hypothetical protein